MPPQPPKLLEQVRNALRARHYSAHAEQATVAWITRFILFHDKQHPNAMTASDVMAFLNSLADTAERNAARLAILFLYRQVLNRPLDLPSDAPATVAPAMQRAAVDPLAALLDQAREALRVKHYAYSTEQSYLDWIKRFIRYHNQRHRDELGGAAVAAFLTYLAVEGHVSASTQDQALAALLFLYREVLRQELAYPIDNVRAKKSQHLPAVLTKEEVRRVDRPTLRHLSAPGPAALRQRPAPARMPASARQGSRLRPPPRSSCAIPRVIQDRVTMLPESVVEPLREHLQQVRRLHEADLAKGYGAVYLPDALARKYPNASHEWIWQYVFPSDQLSADPRSGEIRRHHLDESGLQPRGAHRSPHRRPR